MDSTKELFKQTKERKACCVANDYAEHYCFKKNLLISIIDCTGDSQKLLWE